MGSLWGFEGAVGQGTPCAHPEEHWGEQIKGEKRIGIQESISKDVQDLCEEGGGIRPLLGAQQGWESSLESFLSSSSAGVTPAGL